jgi:hypothetical protein
MPDAEVDVSERRGRARGVDPTKMGKTMKQRLIDAEKRKIARDSGKELNEVGVLSVKEVTFDREGISWVGRMRELVGTQLRVYGTRASFGVRRFKWLGTPEPYYDLTIVGFGRWVCESFLFAKTCPTFLVEVKCSQFTNTCRRNIVLIVLLSGMMFWITFHRCFLRLTKEVERLMRLEESAQRGHVSGRAVAIISEGTFQASSDEVPVWRLPHCEANAMDLGLVGRESRDGVVIERTLEITRGSPRRRPDAPTPAHADCEGGA